MPVMDGEFRLGEVLAGKYVIENELGRGGMGVVFAARHLGLGSRVAIKVLRAVAAEADERSRRFIREAQAAAGIESQHVARVFDVGLLDSGRPYMVMEYLEGMDGARLLEMQGSIPVAEAAGYLLQTLDALGEAHSLGIVHRDLKPSNLFFARRRNGSFTVKVLDFGVSKISHPVTPAVASDATSASALLGTPHYMSPEQLRAARDVDARADIWSLGVILYRFVTGELPFQEETFPELCAAIIGGSPGDMRDVLTGAPSALAEILNRCLAKDPAKRYATAHELADALRALAPSEPVLASAALTSAAPSRAGTAPSRAVEQLPQLGLVNLAGAAPPAPLDSGDTTPQTLTRDDERWKQPPKPGQAPKGRSRVLVALALVALLILATAFSRVVFSPTPVESGRLAAAVSTRLRAVTSQPALVPQLIEAASKPTPSVASGRAPSASTAAARAAASSVRRLPPTVPSGERERPVPSASAAPPARSEMGGRL